MSEAHELRNLGNSRSYGAGTYSDIAGHRYHQKDVHTLARLGKKQVLKVGLENWIIPFTETACS